MEGKTVILSVLIMTLFMAQIQVEAAICCPSISARATFNVCELEAGFNFCLKESGCKDVFSESGCPPGYPFGNLENSGEAVNEYCKLGCAFSVCGAMTTLQNSDANEIVNEAVEKCNKACSTLCNKGSLTAVKSA